MKLTCDLCSSDLQMNPGGRGATCTNCGLEYTKERLLEKLGTSNSAKTTEALVEPAAEPAVTLTGTPKTETADVFAPPTPSPKLYNLHLKRKFNLSAMAALVAIYVDGQRRVTLSVNQQLCIPITQGHHVIQAQVTGVTNTPLNPIAFEVTDRDIYGEFFVRTRAFSAEYVFELKDHF